MVIDMKHTVEVMIPEAEIKARIAELGRQITERYKDSGSDMVLVGSAAWLIYVYGGPVP